MDPSTRFDCEEPNIDHGALGELTSYGDLI
jgi:hypothetical protein